MIAAGMFIILWRDSKSRLLTDSANLAVTLNVRATTLYPIPGSHTSYVLLTYCCVQWSQKPPCGSFLELRRKKESPTTTTLSSSLSTTSITAASSTSSVKPVKYADSIIVRVMDSCAGCKAGIPHVDLTKAAFKQLYALDIG